MKFIVIPIFNGILTILLLLFAIDIAIDIVIELQSA